MTDNWIKQKITLRAALLIVLVGVGALILSTTQQAQAQNPTPRAPMNPIYMPLLMNGIPAASEPTNPHASLTTYEGSATCITCHAKETSDLHSTVHYQWSGFTPDVVGGESGGKATSLNDFCGYPGVNTWLGKMVNVDGVTVDGGCATCHVGIGAKPLPDQTTEQMANMDCLVCHSDQYKRKVELVNGAYKMVPAPENMSVSLPTALSNIGKPTKAACIACHAYGGGGANNKRGDIEPILSDPPSTQVDVHMASKSVGGAGFTCTNCHTTQDHHIAGRGSDLRPTDLNVVMSCDTCHTATPHDSADLNKHTARVNCTVCHIQSFARNTSTDMYRDFRVSELDVVKRLYEPKITRQANVTPVYRFFNGSSSFYNLGEPAVVGANNRVLLAGPLGSVQDAQAKISPFKQHTATQPYDVSTNAIIPLKMGIVFQKGDMNGAISAGASAMGWPLPQGFSFLNTERIMQINHGVTPASSALSCDSCHNGGTRLDFAQLGYTPKTTRNAQPLCASCHEDQSNKWTPAELFDKVHNKHVTGENINCSECHTFSKVN